MEQSVEISVEHPCPVDGCNRTFPTKRGLNYHIARTHGHYCWVCGRLFGSRTQLDNHTIAEHGVGR